MAIKKHDSVRIKPFKKVVALPLLDDLRRMIDETRQAVSTKVNVALTMLYWNVGRRIREDVLQEKRAEYGREILPTLSAKLTIEYGRGWNERNLAYMVKFAEIFLDETILHALCAKLSWSHFRLLFYHRRLRCLVAIELKLGEFKPAFKGQMELYLRWLDKYERREGEDAPLGMILCAGKKQEQIELLELGRSGIHVAEYLTDSLPKEILHEKLRKAIALARKCLENRGEELIAKNVAKLLEGK